MEALRRLGGSCGPGDDVDILLLEQVGEQRALALAPGQMVSVEETADQKVGFPGSAMMRSPVKALQLSVWVHGRNLGSKRRHCECLLAALETGFG
jgi:hypothetical protein